MGQSISNVDGFEIQIINARMARKNHIAVNMVTAEEEKALVSRGYSIEHIGGGSMALEHGGNYLIKWE
jgi:hypothetical protein